MASEKIIEKYLKKQVEKRNGLCLKFVSPGFTGVPDRICLLPGGLIIFVETKSSKGKPSQRQLFVKKQFEELGFTVKIIKSKDEIHSI